MKIWPTFNSMREFCATKITEAAIKAAGPSPFNVADRGPNRRETFGRTPYLSSPS